MSNTDSFIEEVTEEVRRDRLYANLRRYGWIAVLAVLLLVGGAAYKEWTKSKTRAQAEGLGDAILMAMEVDDRSERAAALGAIDVVSPGGQAVVAMLAASEESADAPAAAAARLLALTQRNDIDLIYRQIATLKAVAIPEADLTTEDRRGLLDGLALGRGVVRLLAEEQLAYLDIAEGDTEAAEERLQQIFADSETTEGLRRRVSQVILAMGGEIAPLPDDQ